MHTWRLLVLFLFGAIMITLIVGTILLYLNLASDSLISLLAVCEFIVYAILIIYLERKDNESTT